MGNVDADLMMCFVLAAAVDAAHVDDGLMQINLFGTAYLIQYLLDSLDRIEGAVVLVAGLVDAVVEQLLHPTLQLGGAVALLRGRKIEGEEGIFEDPSWSLSWPVLCNSGSVLVSWDVLNAGTERDDAKRPRGLPPRLSLASPANEEGKEA